MLKKYTGLHHSRTLRAVACGLVLGLVCIYAPALRAAGPSDPFGVLDKITVERTVVEAAASGPTQVAVRVLLTNDEQIGSVSIPLVFDQSKMTLTSIDYTNSRASHIATRLVSPNPVAAAPGHFLVGIVRIQESAIQPGDGLLFTIHFTLNAPLLPGDSTKIDSLFFAPAGELVMAEAGTAGTIHPAFVAGNVVLRAANRPPQVAPVANLSVLEGELLNLGLTATDPDTDPLSFSVTAKPSGAMLTDHANGTATLTWTPGFTGPGSADGSPYNVTLKVSDGKSSSFQTFAISVINRNRAPVLSAPSIVSVKAGLPVSFAVTGTDPDFESITYSAKGIPGSAIVSPTSGQFTWETVLADSGLHVVSIIGTDPVGGADTVVTTIKVDQALVYQLAIDSVSANLGGVFTLPIRLANLVPVTGFELLIVYDPTLISFVSATNAGTRSGGFEEFTSTNNYNGVVGHLYLRGKTDLPAGSVTPPLVSGSGIIANLKFQVASDLAYSGLSVATRFDMTNPVLNILFDSTGKSLNRSEITFSNGLVTINSIGQIQRGDINLNGIPYEIGDAIYFTNFVIDPFNHPFSLVQYANSDINGDGLVATISDLVRLINIIVQGVSAPSSGFSSSPSGSSQPVAEASLELVNTETTLNWNSVAPTGAILCTFPHAASIDPVSIHSLVPEMTMDANRSGDTLRVLVYSLSGGSIASGTQAILSLPDGLSADGLTIAAASSSGDEMAVRLGAVVPSSMQLAQNYPNPFNPETTISFSLAERGPVELVIHNITGQVVRVLTDDVLDAGQHDVRWNGTDERGLTVASGVYFYRLTSRGETATRKMLLMK